MGCAIPPMEADTIIGEVASRGATYKRDLTISAKLSV